MFSPRQQQETFVHLFCLQMLRLFWNPHHTPLPVPSLQPLPLASADFFDNKPSGNLFCGPTSHALHVCDLGLE